MGRLFRPSSMDLGGHYLILVTLLSLLELHHSPFFRFRPPCMISNLSRMDLIQSGLRGSSGGGDDEDMDRGGCGLRVQPHRWKQLVQIMDYVRVGVQILY
jgi:hypothetical protein